MIQFNLLPDVKLEYIRTQRTKRTVVLIAGLVSGVSISLALLLFLAVNVAQRTHLNNLNNDISQLSQELETTPDLDKVLTVQNQLSRLAELHDKKPVATRLSDYITQVTPNEVTIGELVVSFEDNTILFKGAADSLKTVNEFVDTLKFTDYETEEGAGNRAFSDVVLRNFGRDSETASYEVELIFDPVIFSSAVDIEFVVPQTTTTRSVTEKPSPLFQPLNNPEENGQGD